MRDSLRQQTCNFVRLLEKGQHNISKQAAVEKEPLTIEKDKEGQRKFYDSYPNPHVLDMKWQNCDIIVAKPEPFQSSVS